MIRSSATISEASDPVDEVAVLVVQLGPLLLVALEVDLERVPLRVLPAPVEGLGVVELDLGLGHAGTRARMIAEAACSWTRWVSWISTSSKPAAASSRSNSSRGQRPGDAAGPLLHVSARRLVHVRVGDDVADGEPAAGPQHPRRLAEDGGLVAGEVDHAVGDDHVDRVVGQRDVLDRALDELDVLDPGLALVCARQLEHLVGHVQAVGLAGRPDAAGREQDVDPAAGAEVEHGLALVQLGDRGRVAAAEAGQLGGLGQGVTVVGAVEAGAEQLALLVGDHGRVAAARRLAGSPPRPPPRSGRARSRAAHRHRREPPRCRRCSRSSGLVLGPAALALRLGLAARLLRRRSSNSSSQPVLVDGL